MNKKNIITIIGSVMALLVSTLHADLFVYEGFDYADGTSLGASGNGGSGWSGNWTQEAAGSTPADLIISSNATNTAANLTQTGLRVGKTSGGPDTHTRYSRSFNALNFSDSDVLWFSYAYNANPSGFDNGLEFYDGGNRVLAIGGDPTKASSPTDLRGQISVLDDDNTRIQSTAALNSSGSSTQNYFVGKITFGAGSETLDLYYGSFFPVGEGGLPVNMGTVFTGQSIDDISSIDTLTLNMNNSGIGYFDEIRLGDSFASVRLDTIAVPEPSTFTLLGLGFAYLVLVRRYRK